MADSYIKVKNSGGFVARFSASYNLSGREITQDSGNFTAGVSKTMTIPAEATNIQVKVQEEYFISSWSTVAQYSFDRPETRCYDVYGTTLDAHCKEITC